MIKTESINIFSNRSIAKNASIILATPVYLGKCGAETKFYGDVTASGGGTISIRYQGGLTPDDTFFTPANASPVCASMLSSINTASRDLFAFSIKQMPWVKFKAKENNASPVEIDFNLIINRD
jgi:hypothetical protein